MYDTIVTFRTLSKIDLILCCIILIFHLIEMKKKKGVVDKYG